MNTPAYPFIAADKATSAKAVGLSDRVLDEAVRDNELVVHYWGRKPVFRAVDLDEWIRSLPTERAAS